MAGFRRPSSEGSHLLNIQDGTLCRAESPKPGPIGADPFSAIGLERRIRVLGFDGAKTHDFLFNVSLAEIEWQELNANPRAAVDSIVPTQRALEGASVLYDEFLDACSKGPNYATAFLAEQHDRQRKYLHQSLAVLQSLQRENAHYQLLLAKIEFGAQVVKSLATAGVAIMGLFLAVPEVVTGAGIAFGYDVVIETVKRLGSSNKSGADTVLVGFKQTVANDAANVLASGRQVTLEGTRRVLQRTLNYPLKSTMYRSTIATVARLDVLLKTLGGLSVAVTIYTEALESIQSFEQIQKAGSQ
jgi:hypothetical protein